MNTARLSLNTQKTTRNIYFRTDEKPRHRIYDRLLFHLENKRVRFIETNQTLPFILHQQTKKVLNDVDGLSKADIERLENGIARDAENMTDYEVVGNLPAALFYELRRTAETDLIAKKRAVGIPNSILNSLVCAALEKEFSRDEILACEGFILRDGYTRLDLDETFVRSGFITPKISHAGGLIVALKVFRYPKDRRPFVLRSRQSNYFSGEFS